MGDEKTAKKDLIEALTEFDEYQGKSVGWLADAIEALIEERVASAMEEMANRVEDALGARP